MSNINDKQSSNNIQEDEIDLRELWQTILEGKIIIASIVLVIVSFAFIYALKLPNVYESKTVLIPTEDKAAGGLGGLGGLAAMAGVSLGGGGSSMTPDVAFNSLLDNYTFMRKFVINNAIVEHYSSSEVDENYVFALGYRGVYDFFNSKSDDTNDKVIDYDGAVFNTINSIKGKLSITSCKSGLIEVSFSDSDRSYPPKIITAFLKDASEHLVNNNLKNLNVRLKYFEEELFRIDSFELRKSLSEIVSSILEEKIMMQSKEYYQCDVLSVASESYIKAKTKPKRALILVVSFVTSIILGIFLVFLLQFIKSTRDTKAGTL